MADVFSGLVRREPPEHIADRDPLTKGPVLVPAEPLQQLRLTHQTNLEKRPVSVLEVRKQAELLERRVR
jgi:hypothetical protein